MSFFGRKLFFKASQKTFQRLYEDVQGIYKVPLTQLYAAAKKITTIRLVDKKIFKKNQNLESKKILSCIPLYFSSRALKFILLTSISALLSPNCSISSCQKIVEKVRNCIKEFWLILKKGVWRADFEHFLRKNVLVRKMV